MLLFQICLLICFQIIVLRKLAFFFVKMRILLMKYPWLKALRYLFLLDIRGYLISFYGVVCSILASECIFRRGFQMLLSQQFLLIISLTIIQFDKLQSPCQFVELMALQQIFPCMPALLQLISFLLYLLGIAKFQDLQPSQYQFILLQIRHLKYSIQYHTQKLNPHLLQYISHEFQLTQVFDSQIHLGKFFACQQQHCIIQLNDELYLGLIDQHQTNLHIPSNQDQKQKLFLLLKELQLLNFNSS